MSTLTALNDTLGLVNHKSPQIGFWRRAFHAVIQARQRSAQVQVQRFLANYNDAQLTTYGYTTVEIAAIRKALPSMAAFIS